MPSSVVEHLIAARTVAWRRLQPVFDHAIALALEAEYQARAASIEATNAVGVPGTIPPAYPPLVTMLAESVDLKADGLVSLKPSGEDQ